MFICLLFFIAYVDASFVREAPVLWNTEKIYALKGQNSVMMRILYENPCTSIKKLINMPELVESLAVWCNRALVADFVEPIQSFCKERKSDITKGKYPGYLPT